MRVPERVDLRDICSPIRDQDALGSCTAFAVTSLIESLYLRAGERRELSPMFTYYYGRAWDSRLKQKHGSHLLGSLKAARAVGVANEADVPYNIKRWRETPELRWAKKGIGRIIWLTHTKQLHAHLRLGYPSVIVANVLDSIVDADTFNVVPTEGNYTLGAHALLAVGYDLKAKTLLCKNSWGTDWCDRCYFNLPLSMVQYAATARL